MIDLPAEQLAQVREIVRRHVPSVACSSAAWWVPSSCAWIEDAPVQDLVHRPKASFPDSTV